MNCDACSNRYNDTRFKPIILSQQLSDGEYSLLNSLDSSHRHYVTDYYPRNGELVECCHTICSECYKGAASSSYKIKPNPRSSDHRRYVEYTVNVSKCPLKDCKCYYIQKENPPVNKAIYKIVESPPAAVPLRERVEELTKQVSYLGKELMEKTIEYGEKITSQVDEIDRLEKNRGYLVDEIDGLNRKIHPIIEKQRENYIKDRRERIDEELASERSRRIGEVDEKIRGIEAERMIEIENIKIEIVHMRQHKRNFMMCYPMIYQNVMDFNEIMRDEGVRAKLSGVAQAKYDTIVKSFQGLDCSKFAEYGSLENPFVKRE